MKLKLLPLLFLVSLSFSQTKDDIGKITKNYDVQKIKQKIIYFENTEKKEKEIAVKKQMKWDGLFLFMVKMALSKN